MNDILAALPADCKSSQPHLTVPDRGRSALKHVSPNTGFFSEQLASWKWRLRVFFPMIPTTPIPLFHIQTLGARQFDTSFCNKPGQAGFLTHPAQKANLSQSTYWRFTSRLSELQPGN